MNIRLAAIAASAALALAGFSAALAAPASAPNPNAKPASGNCIAEYSAAVTANGLADGETLGVGNNVSGDDNTSHGQRGDEIKALQASCAHD